MAIRSETDGRVSRRHYWGEKRDQGNSYRRRYDQPCRSTFDTRRIRRLNCRLPTQVRTDPSMFDSKCIRVDDGCDSMSDKCTPVESAFRLGFCAWAKAQAPTRAKGNPHERISITHRPSCLHGVLHCPPQSVGRRPYTGFGHRDTRAARAACTRRWCAPQRHDARENAKDRRNTPGIDRMYAEE